MRGAVTLTRDAAQAALVQLAESPDRRALSTYLAIMRSVDSRNWGFVTVGVHRGELKLLRQLGLPGRLIYCPCRPRWVATYGDPDRPGMEVVVRTSDKPMKKRVFKVPGARRKLTLVRVERLKGDSSVARATKAVKDKVELEDLEELDELEELEEEEAPKPRRSRTRTRRAAKVEEVEEVEEEDDEEDEEDDDEEEPAPRRRRTRAAAAPAKPTRTRRTRTAANGAKASPTPPVRELPAGKLGVEDVAKMAGTDARAVRVYLRKQDALVKTDGRWAFSKREAESLAKKMKAR